jgi:hypothetical protein
MFSWLTGVFKQIWKFWNRLDEKTKRAIIEEVVKSFEKMFRAFYKTAKNYS